MTTSTMTSDSRIHVLPDLLINKIAAGEVVERPASVVKELVENAVDAQASRIAVTVEEGGRKLLRVTDDGCGMNSADLRLAITPHATSKVMVEDDLYAIETMGFRGEALASIAAVSKLRIVSRTEGAVEGYEVRMAGDRFETAQAAGCPVGTTVEVRDLFFNTPARRKFLRTPSTETGHISEQFARIALAYPRIAFELTNNGRVTQHLPACDNRLKRISKFYGPELADALMHIERDERDVNLEIFAAPPVQSRANTQWQYVYVNGRYVRDRFIQHAIKEAYRGLMEPNRHGVVFLFLTVDPRNVDVNVHPTKIEVRWANSSLIHSQVLSALRETFQRCDLTPALRTDKAREFVSEEEQNRIRRETADALKAMAPIQPATGSVGGSFSPDRPAGDYADRYTPNRIQGLDAWKALYSRPTTEPPGPIKDANDALAPTQVADAPSTAENYAPDADPQPLPNRAVQMHNLYLVAETDDGIVIIDQHALHERIMYEQLRARFTEGPLESQRLLLPETIRITPRQGSLLEDNADLLTRLGLEVSAFGTDSVAVHAFPTLLKDTDVVSFMHDLLDQLGEQPEAGHGRELPAGAATPEVVIHKILDMMACKAAIKAGDPLTPQEIDALMQQRHLIDKSSNCPHGRPTTLRLTKADLNRQFKRT
ncbi:MAG: DNA mismatch repair endonuclease MutL [Planctomycetes bacterium]|nr:DNA mismatch repair endonuclease MutL [Planctomycetota bacterium]